MTSVEDSLRWSDETIKFLEAAAESREALLLTALEEIAAMDGPTSEYPDFNEGFREARDRAARIAEEAIAKTRARTEN